ncbi:hypothetical protein EVAR_42633_1 [Eumeta japonica]|uniref:Uncharacterized protein n=1 Tax=Eumeta variegata TaxID=151549 RepID=A0A4C1WZC8_EUMVA|nr:hypothetical protein EVAR_42633_1 [Eumeta japonica]
MQGSFYQKDLHLCSPSGNRNGCDRAVLWPTSLHHKNEFARSVKYYTFTEYGHEVPTSAVGLRPVSESSNRPIPSLPSINPILLHCLVTIALSPSQEAGKALVAPLRLRVFTDGGDYPFSIDSSCLLICSSTMLFKEKEFG